ncbi:MAG TPA: hypothetical protein VMZ53_07595 [Kofleriaceae bacterium]|nr:hypothetical protein [Kofleriaceae bacterium]
MSFATRAILVGGLLAAIAVLATCQHLPLLTWTPQLVEPRTYPLLFGQLFVAWLALAVSPRIWRRPILVIASLASLVTLSPLFAVVAVVHAGLTTAVLRAPLPRIVVLAFLVGSVAAAVAVGNAELGDEARRLAIVFALGQTFRLFALYHAARVAGARPLSLVDTFLYLHLLPCNVIVPYMLCIPRVERFRKSLDTPRAFDVRLLAAGAVVGVLVHAGLRVFDPKIALLHAAQAHDIPRVAAFALLFYPLSGVLGILGPAWILTGMMRLVGIDVDPPFDHPLSSTSFLEWWRRWNTHFRDLLVDLFFFPVVLGRLRRRRRIATVIGAAAVFLVGSTLFHMPKHMLLVAHGWEMPWGLFAENVVSFVFVTVGLLQGARRRPPRRRLTAIFVTWIVVFVAVHIGYLVGWSLHPDRLPKESSKL